MTVVGGTVVRPTLKSGHHFPILQLRTLDADTLKREGRKRSERQNIMQAAGTLLSSAAFFYLRLHKSKWVYVDDYSSGRPFGLCRVVSQLS
jgi:hypothetical protein